MGVWKSKTRGWWVAKFQFQGKRHKKEGFKSRMEAILWESSKREELLAPQIETPSISLHDLATEYLTHCQARMQKNTWKQKAFVYRSFLAFLGNDQPIANIITKQITDYLNNRASHRGKKVANRDLRDLKALFNWGIEQDIIGFKNPCKRIEKFPEDPYVPYIPPAEDIDRVKMAATRDEQDFIEVVYHTMGRKSEIARLIWDDINLEQRWVRLFTRKRKGGELQEDYLPMNDTLYTILNRRWQRRDKFTPYIFQFNKDYLDHMMRRLCEKAKVKPFGFHAIRHHVASVLNDSGKASMKQIQLFLRHKRQSTTEVYLHSIDHGLFEVAGLLDGKVTHHGTPNREANKKEDER